MSNDVFPRDSFKGITFSQFKTATFSRRVQRSVSGREIVRSEYANPIWNFRLPFSFLRDYPVGLIESEMRLLLNFYSAMVLYGDTFLYVDPSDYSVTDSPLGTGDGVTTAFQLIRYYYPGFTAEDIIAPTNISEVKVGGVPTLAYAIDPGTGIITFDVAPGLGAAVTASFTYYFRCRFSDDALELEKFGYAPGGGGLWKTKELRFRSVIL
jgi:hypothetical protein